MQKLVLLVYAGDVIDLYQMNSDGSDLRGIGAITAPGVSVTRLTLSR